MRFVSRHHAALLVSLGATACGRTDLPNPSSETYAEAVSAFYRGIAAAQVGEGGLAEAAFARVAELAPGEPAGWVDGGLIALQRRELERAAERLGEASALAPENSHVRLVSAVVDRERGLTDATTEHLRRAVEADSANLRALYLLAQVVEQADPAAGATEAARLIDRILDAQPGNLVALLERGRLAARAGDGGALGQMIDRIGLRADSLSLPVADELRAVRSAATEGDFGRAATEMVFLQAALQPLSAYTDDQETVVISPSRLELLMTAFVRLLNPIAMSAPPDTALAFVPETLNVAPEPVAWVIGLWLSDLVPLALVAANPDSVWVSTEPDRADAFAFPGGASAQLLSPNAVAAIDYDYDFQTDLVLAGAGGLRLLRQDGIGNFTDVTGEAVGSAVAGGAYAGAWAADLDMEGDLDLVLAGVEGSPVVLRNLGDGRFESYPEFGSVTQLRDYVWADLDADGDPDAVLLDEAGGLHVFLNGRSQVIQFERLPPPSNLGTVQAMATADLNKDATLDLILLQNDGSLSRISWNQGAWETELVARWAGFSPADVASARVIVADLDNNGDLDLVASTPAGTRAWLRTPSGMRQLSPVDIRVTAVADISGEGRLDLIGISDDGQSRMFANQGTLDYFSTTIRTQAAQATGDRRVNSFGIGGEIEVRAGLLYQKQLISSPAVHFGLGEQSQVDVARIIWPNGSVQAEFNLAATNETILTRQRLKGSCPWVFTYDGEGMQFVTDFLWRSALGLRINAQGDALVIHSEDWIKIRGDQLAPRDGLYDVRITAELWETHFFDHVSLTVVDHPEGTEVFIDERFTLPAPELVLHAVEPLRPVVWARDDRGRDVTERAGMLDERYVDTFELGPYQGIAHEHYVEVELGDDVPAEGPLWLVASGWIYPTDASINVAMSQGDHPMPHGLQLEVPDGKGGWRIVESDLGFPSGKTKTILVDLEGEFRPGTARRLRLRTNMEIYWDRLAWTVGSPDAAVATRRIFPVTADLRYRGFSETVQASRKAPEIPVYDQIATSAPLWRDLVGFHTRFGDVLPLNETVDDRYTIMNAGDELLLRFPAEPPPPEGWTRDFVLIGDGWVKDGDYNTGFSTTVLPLPYHGMPDYSRTPGRMADDPAYQRHPEDWDVFHTRFVTPRVFHRALAPPRKR